MKHLILLLILLLTTPCIAQDQLARMSIGVMGGAVTAAGLTCSGATVQQEETTINTAGNLCSAGATSWRATQITYSGTTGTLCQFSINADCPGGACVFNLTGYLYADSGSDTVGALASTCSVTATTQSTSDVWLTFTGCSGTLTNTTKYWLAVGCSGSGAAYFTLNSDTDCTTERTSSSSDGTTWGAPSTGACHNHKVYILE